MGHIGKGHRELDEHGVGKCSVPMWRYPGVPAGFCDKPAFGEQVRRLRELYVPALACPAHGGPERPVLRVLFAGEGPDLRFVEVEDATGRSVRAGEWTRDGDYHVLEIPRADGRR